MTEKQKALAVVWIVLVAVAFVLIYWQFSSRKSVVPETEFSSAIPPSAETSAPSLENATSESSALSTTPDNVTDDILRNDADTSALDDEANGEANAAKENSQAIDDITNAYDEKQL